MLKLDIQMFADGKVVIDTELNSKNFENGLNKMQSTTQKAGNTIKSIVAGLGISKAISMAISTINNSIDSSIDRLDTLRNFPKVMSNLGIAGDKAQASINKMSDKLSGLPTTLDQGAMAVQRFASANSDVEKSTDIFLALNNAILAGGASSEIQTSALEQLSQAYAKGKPDMMEWRTAMTAMPAQLKQVATAMGYVSADELGEALREGTVSMDEFMEAIVQLNEEGLEGFQSFETQARNSVGGIKTSITVAKTQIVKGVTDIIDALDVKLEELGIGKISDIISNIGKKAKEGLDVIAGLISGELTIKDVIGKATNLISTFIDTANKNLPSIIKTGAEMLVQFITGFAQALPTLIPQIVDVILTIIESFIDNIDLFVDAGIELMIGLAEGLIDALPVLIDKLPDIIEKLANAIIDNLPRIVDAGLKITIKLAEGLLKGIAQLLSEIPSMVWNLGVALVKGIGNGISQSFSWLNKRLNEMKENIIGFFKNLPQNMLNIGVNLVKGLWNGIKNATNWLMDKIKGFAKGILDGIKGIFGIHSPSVVMRDQVGKFLAQGVGVGFEDELDSVYAKMQKAINFENTKLQANVETGKVFNTLANTTPIYVQVDADVEMDNTKVGRIITPVVSETLKTGGLR